MAFNMILKFFINKTSNYNGFYLMFSPDLRVYIKF